MRPGLSKLRYRMRWDRGPEAFRMGIDLLAAALLITICLSGAVFAADGLDTPNIVVILADDLGYGDVSSYNPDRGKIPTPNIDRLAKEGMRFTDGHSSSGVCSPSRYTLLTGRYHWRTWLQAGIVGVFGEPLIVPDRMTIGTLAKARGYRTACFGKWHLGWDWPIPAEEMKYFRVARNQKETPPPTKEQVEAWQRVFSQRIPGGPTERGFDEYFGTDVPNWPPFCFIKNDRTVGIPSVLLPDRFLGAEPRMASLPGPALPDWRFGDILPTITDRACEFIRQCGEDGKPFLLYFPLTSPHEPLAVNEPWKGKSGLNVYADFVMETDAMVGRVLDTLDEIGVTDKTLVIFTSDNGKARYTGAEALEKMGHFSSGPFRDYKASVYEGGHRVPFIVRWPKVVPPGSVCIQLVHQADLFATLAEILEVPIPPNAGEDSFSLLPLFRGENRSVRPHAVSCASSGVPSVREGPWKLILNKNPELYQLDNDPGETANLADRYSDRVEAMKKLLEKIIRDGRSTPGPQQKNDVPVKRYP
ncbi:MAG TPA: arylsulfatase [Thermogutta sp.]|nr:arylsulfatase [Thermogutta sp.]HQF12769.1 arylsulfatase [Thermogutta sp.]